MKKTLLALLFFPLLALAQQYPTKPVRIILPYLGGADFVGRFLAARLTPGLGQQVIIDPRPGAGGNLGHEATAKAAPTTPRGRILSRRQSNPKPPRTSSGPSERVNPSPFRSNPSRPPVSRSWISRR